MFSWLGWLDAVTAVVVMIMIPMNAFGFGFDVVIRDPAPMMLVVHCARAITSLVR